MSTRWLCAAVVAALTAASLAAADPAAAANVRLLHRYQPVVVTDPLEPFPPTTVRGFVDDSVLETQTSPNTWVVADADPRPGDLPHSLPASCSAAGCWRLNQASCSPAGGVAAIGCYSEAAASGGSGPAVYARIAYRPRKLVLQYWLFSYDDVYSYDYPPDGLFWQAHEGDWEVVNVVLDRSTRRPIEVAFSQHCTGERRAWTAAERVGSHPIDHVAIGSHANLLDAGANPVATACIPPQALAILAANGLPAPVDRSGEGTRYGPAGMTGVTAMAVRRIGRRVTPWADFPGTWGEAQYFHAPDPIGTVALGTSPDSPARTALWKRPLQVIRAWPEGWRERHGGCPVQSAGRPPRGTLTPSASPPRCSP